ncbi:hypothetical protein ACVWY2_004951 [Bradyrhizobium sp. JR6.1]
MSDFANYIAHENSRDGRPVEIRALRPDDEADMLAALEQTSARSLQRRFFVMKRHFSDKERAFFLDIDFSNHVALAVLAEQAGRKVIIGGGRYIVFAPGRAEMAFMVIDSWQCARDRLDADAPSHQARGSCRAKGTDRGSPAGKRGDAERVPQVRL